MVGSGVGRIDFLGAKANLINHQRELLSMMADANVQVENFSLAVQGWAAALDHYIHDDDVFRREWDENVAAWHGEGPPRLQPQPFDVTPEAWQMRLRVDQFRILCSAAYRAGVGEVIPKPHGSWDGSVPDAIRKDMGVERHAN